MCRKASTRRGRAEPRARRRAPLRARLQRPLRPDRAAARPRRGDGRAEGPRPRVRRALTRRAPGHPALVAVAQDASGQALDLALAYGTAHRLRPRGHARDDVRGGDRERPLRRAGRAVRRRHAADPGRLRDARRGGLPARDRLLRVPQRAEADRRPDLRGRLRVHALLDLRRRRVRRPHARARGSSTNTSRRTMARCSRRSAAARSPAS